MKANNNRKDLLKSAAIGLLALVFLYLGYNFLKGVNLFERNNIYYVNLVNAKDVTVSTPILIDGYRVGLVREVKYDYSNFRGTMVKMAVDKKLQIPKGSFITVKGNPLSGAELAIVKAKNFRSYYQNEDTLFSKTNADLIAQVSDDIVPSLVKMINKIDTLMVGLDKIINNKYIQSTFEQVNYASINIKKSSESLRYMMTEQLPSVVSNVDKGVLSIGKLSHKLDSIDIHKTIYRVDQVLAQLDTVSQQLKRKDNTAGLLLNDKQLYMRLRNSAASLDSLLVDIQRNPSRYVNFSLF